jgi:DNA-binding transcriptional LysR family regulator
MQLEAIKVFCDLATLRSFSKAAAANGKSQPAVSRIVHELERRLKGQLIDRSHRPLLLTPLGQAYFEGCRQLLEQYLQLEASLIQSPPLALTVRVAAIYSVGLSDIHQYKERFEAEHPHVRAHVDYLHPEQVYERIRDGAADFGLVSFPRLARDLVVLPWREEEMVVACPPGHPLAQFSSVRLEQLAGEKFVAFEERLTIRHEIDRLLGDHGVTVEVAAAFDNIESIKKGIEVGAGLALLPEPTFRQEVQDGSLRAVRLEGSALIRPLGIVYRRKVPPGAAAGDFIRLLRGDGSPPPLDDAGAFSASQETATGPSTNGRSTHRNGRPRMKRTTK